MAGILRLKVTNFAFLPYVLTVRPANPEGNPCCLSSSRFGDAVSCLQRGPKCVRRGCAARVLLQRREGMCEAKGLRLTSSKLTVLEVNKHLLQLQEEQDLSTSGVTGLEDDASVV